MANRIFIPAIALAASAMAFSASAQLLGGGGGLTGSTLDTADELSGTGRGDTHIDRRSGRVQGKGSADARGSGSVDGNSNLIGNTIGGNAGGSTDASAASAAQIDRSGHLTTDPAAMDASSR